MAVSLVGYGGKLLLMNSSTASFEKIADVASWSLPAGRTRVELHLCRSKVCQWRFHRGLKRMKVRKYILSELASIIYRVIRFRGVNWLVTGFDFPGDDLPITLKVERDVGFANLHKRALRKGEIRLYEFSRVKIDKYIQK